MYIPSDKLSEMIVKDIVSCSHDNFPLVYNVCKAAKCKQEQVYEDTAVTQVCGHTYNTTTEGYININTQMQHVPQGAKTWSSLIGTT